MSPLDADLGLTPHRVPMADGSGTLHVRVGGPEGGVPVVLLHGFPETGFAWRHQVPALLADGHRVFVPDQRGYGASDRPRGIGRYVLPHLVDDVIAMVDALGGGGGFHLVGHDWGGAVAWSVARLHPARVRTLTVCNCPPADVLRSAPLFDPAQLLRSWYIGFFQLPWLPERTLHRGAGLRILRGAVDTPEEKAVYKAAWADRDAWRAALDWYRATIQRGQVPRGPVHAPTLLLWGEGDEALGDALAGPSLGGVRNGRLVRVPGDVGHWTPSRGRAVVTPTLRHHLAQHGGSTPTLVRLVPRSVWEAASDPWPGEPMDRDDGYVHLSTPAQVPGTLARFFADRDDVLAVHVDPTRLDPDALRWETGPDGGPFPHLYAPLPHDAVVRVEPARP